MKEKLTIIIILLFTIIVLIFAWFWLENVIEDYDIDRASMDNTFYQRIDMIQSLTERNL